MTLGIVTPAIAKDFSQSDLERIVKELDKAIPENPNLKYPIKCSVVESEDVNAYATAIDEGTDKRATMVVYSGLVKGVNGEERLIRAVVAHELSHLSLNHNLNPKPAARDLKNLWIRQQEFAADRLGADSLVKLGYPRKDMVDMLLYLNSLRGRQGDWLGRLTQDHADPKARAAEVSENPNALKALVTFDSALAFEDARSHFFAKSMFNLAASQWPLLTEAHINAGKCGLLYYYDNLPAAVRTSWWRPDFGSLITDPHAPLPQAVEITDQDREAWKDAMAIIETAVAKNPGNLDAEELQALGQVLEPDAKKEIVEKGIGWFEAHAAGADASIKLRYANNAGVGYQRSGDLTKAYNTIIDAQRGVTKFNSALGENMGLVSVKGRSKDDNELAANVMYTWLTSTPSISPRWATVKTTFDSVCTEAGIQAKEIEKAPIFLCSAISLFTSGKGYGLFLPLGTFTGGLGKPELTTTFSEVYPDLSEVRWHDGKVAVFTERGNVMRVTSYESDAYLLLKPVDATSQTTFKISVGMSKDDLYKVLNEKSGVPKKLARAGAVEEWTYFPSLTMGVLLEDDKVKAITVSPVIAEKS